MTGRGSGRLVHTSPTPAVTIGLTLSTSSTSLPRSSAEPFYIVLTARILSTPHPDKPITLQTHPSPLEGLSNRSFQSITCLTHSNKKIEIYPFGWPQYHWDTQDLRSSWQFVTIPPRNQGVYSVRHEVPHDKIKAADLRQGERYRVALTDKCLGTRWWTYADLDELKGVRFKAWRSQSEEEAEAEEDPEWHEELQRERKEKYGDGPVTMGEDPYILAMVVENEQVEFEIV